MKHSAPARGALAGIKADAQKAKDTGGVYDPRAAGAAWTHNFLNQKPWHPLNFRNQQRVFEAEQEKLDQERRNAEAKAQFEAEQEQMLSISYLSAEGQKDYAARQSVAFMYMKPPGFNEAAQKLAAQPNENAPESQSGPAAAGNEGGQSAAPHPQADPSARQQHRRPRQDGRSAVGNMLGAMAALHNHDKWEMKHVSTGMERSPTRGGLQHKARTALLRPTRVKRHRDEEASRRKDESDKLAERERVRRRRDEKDKSSWFRRDERRSRSRSPPRNDRHRESHRSDSHRHASSSHRRDEHRSSREEKQPLSELDKEELAKQRREKENAELDDEVTRRRKRIETWQAEQRRKAEEAAAAAVAASQPAEAAALTAEDHDAADGVGQWTLEDDAVDDDDPQPAVAADADAPEEGTDEVDPLDAFMADNDAQAAAAMPQPAVKDEEVDPLDAFMSDLQADAPKEAVMADATNVREGKGENGAVMAKARAPKQRKRKRYHWESSSSSEDLDSDEQEDLSDNDEEWAKNVTAGKLSKGEKLGVVDHSTMDYHPFRRDFYIEVPELARLTPEEVAESRKQLDGIKVRGKDVPKPVRFWWQCGLSSRALEVLRKGGFTAPMPIQAQALPVIMSGRDCIGIAKTGSGKTLAFVLPLLRHIKDQRPIEQHDGPIALIMAPTRELVAQIGKDVNRFAKQLMITCVCVYGGSGVGSQITDLKRGCEIVVCTPGRMIDILATSSGKITNLHRVTYLVLDEADRMFDMGFEPQINLIVNNIRPDRQTVMFSATFPRQVEVLARAVLQSPVEIQVGGRSVVNADIQQSVELRPEGERFLRLLEILGEWYVRGKILVFVHTQDGCDDLFRDLLKVGYPVVSLHGGKDQMDRESTLNDFKGDVSNLLVATSVAARGLDVKELVLVVNYDPPNHHEDYIHRVGRTGRAGNKGTAITFIGPEEERYAPDLVKALKESNAVIPQDLQALADGFMAKCKAGTAHVHGSGFGGSGFKFDAGEEDAQKTQRQLAIKAVAKDEGAASDSDDDNIIEVDEETLRQREAAAAIASATAAALAGAQEQKDLSPELQAKIKAAQVMANAMSRLAATSTPSTTAPPTAQQAQQPAGPDPNASFIAAAQAIASRIAQEHGMPAVGATPAQPQMGQYRTPQIGQYAPGEAPERKSHFETELEINDFPQHARWKVTHRDFMAQLNELTGAAVTTKGTYVAPGKPIPEGERKLYLIIEGATEEIVKNAKREIKRIIQEMTEKAMRRDNQSLM
ncbi:hypothetical protein WJX73_003655 [Symbiochloris irregularis]|uniref:RNA helicase n=1 Tax=Symbiochloris irregularis TaxID=706552 RepID=A0AAW1PMA9_9CHLO